MSLLDLLLGKPLASDQARAECIGVAAGIPIFGLDALSSAAYGPEAALTLLIPLGAAGIESEEPTSELQSRLHLVCRLLLAKKKDKTSSLQYRQCAPNTLNNNNDRINPNLKTCHLLIGLHIIYYRP